MMLVNTCKQKVLFSLLLLVCLLTAVYLRNGSTLLSLGLYLLSYTGREYAAGSSKTQPRSQWYLAYLLVGYLVYSILGFLLVLASLKNFGRLNTSGIEVTITSVILVITTISMVAARRQQQVGWRRFSPLIFILLMLGAQLLALHGSPLLFSFARLGVSVLILRSGFTHCYLGLNHFLQPKNSHLSRS
ncbi:MAG TPA: hypothetical protein VFC74_08710 [Oscillospiraceae bacterium]|nr:hypothetical protein [Oscillospiraceae bacterium]